MDELIPITIDGVTAARYKRWCGTNPGFANHLRTWGEAGTVKVKTKTTPKLADRGIQCMFVGYALDHPGDCFEMWNPNTGKILVSRDIMRLKRMYYEKVATPEAAYSPIEIDADDDEKQEQQSDEVGEGNGGGNDSNNDNGSDDNDDDESMDSSEEERQPVTTTRSGRTVYPTQRLIEEYGAKEMDVLRRPYEIALTQAELKFFEA